MMLEHRAVMERARLEKRAGTTCFQLNVPGVSLLLKRRDRLPQQCRVSFRGDQRIT